MENQSQDVKDYDWYDWDTIKDKQGRVAVLQKPLRENHVTVEKRARHDGENDGRQ